MPTKIKVCVSIFFFLSGCAGLVYEVVWPRLLGHIFGNTTMAVSTVLTAYMAGLGLGAFAIERFLDGKDRPFKWSGYLEIGVGVYVLCALPLGRRSRCLR